MIYTLTAWRKLYN